MTPVCVCVCVCVCVTQRDYDKCREMFVSCCVCSEFTVGADASVDRQHLDTETNCIVVPDSSPVRADGLLVSWNVFARQPGTVALDVSLSCVLSTMCLIIIIIQTFVRRTLSASELNLRRRFINHH